MAGNARPLEVLIGEQYDYLYKLNPSSEQELNKIKEQIVFLNSKEFNVNSPKDKLPFNLSGYYWQSVLDYNR
jgi:hypothetical protein